MQLECVECELVLRCTYICVHCMSVYQGARVLTVRAHHQRVFVRVLFRVLPLNVVVALIVALCAFLCGYFPSSLHFIV